jgi:very-short-patch-repair endonuclease
MGAGKPGTVGEQKESGIDRVTKGSGERMNDLNKYIIKSFSIDEYPLSDFIAQIDQYSDLVKKMLWNFLCDKLDDIEEELSVIKSPIEQAFFLAMKDEMQWIENKRGVHATFFDPQHKISSDKNIYYADFGIGVLLDDDTSLKWAIECDGHDFHEKTKEQARRDKQRERAILGAGYTVIRFTGSEIHQDPYKCAQEVYSLILAEIRKRT